ncbi:DUF4097 family beta strand repeat-containing protein [Paenibacillus cellulositrophicus]|uniref:DUF4097 family beta strand repeat-containing protein n=1 Tax=Paenibacillus cellulositrophicus TaxID=562959 RepID=UPI0012670E68|nr:DUF4097 family beta strand repeat-containing protein [Paenibacillus cellulositrophicus]
MTAPLETRPPVRKIGKWTTAIGLIGLGVIIILQMNQFISFEVLKYVWPTLLILLGIEVVISNVVHANQRVRLGGGSVTILILLLIVSGAQAIYPDWTFLFNKGYLSAVQGSVPAKGEIKRVEVFLDSGKVNVTEAQGSNIAYEGKVRVRTESSQANADKWTKQHWKSETSGDTLTLTLDKHQPDIVLIGGWAMPEDYFNLQVPESVEVEVHTKNSTIDASGLHAGLTAVTSNGTLNVKDIQGKVSAKTSNGRIVATNINGPSELVTSNGTVTANQLGGPVYIRTSNGAVRGDSGIAGNWDVKTSNGSINLTVSEDGNAKLTAKTSNSSIKGNIGWVDESDSRATATLGDGQYTVGLATSNGSITVNH